MQQPPPQQPPEEISEDLYTSATADLSAGGVAMAREAAEMESQAQGQDQEGYTQPPPAPRPAEPGAGQPPRSDESVSAQASAPPTPASAPRQPSFGTQYTADEMLAEDDAAGRRAIDPGWAMAGGALVALGGGVGGAWLYSRWQRERNRPINRLRRRARGVAGTLGERWEDVGDRFGDVSGRFGDLGEWLPDSQDMRESAPMSGGAAALLLAGLLVARLLHVGGWGQAPVERSKSRAASMAASRASTWRDASQRLGGQLGTLRDLDVQRLGGQLSSLRALDVQAARGRVASLSSSVPAQPMGLSIGGLLGIAALGYLVWRLVRGGGNHRPPEPDTRAWYDGTERREEVPNQ